MTVKDLKKTKRAAEARALIAKELPTTKDDWQRIADKTLFSVPFLKDIAKGLDLHQDRVRVRTARRGSITSHGGLPRAGVTLSRLKFMEDKKRK